MICDVKLMLFMADGSILLSPAQYLVRVHPTDPPEELFNVPSSFWSRYSPQYQFGDVTSAQISQLW